MRPNEWSSRTEGGEKGEARAKRKRKRRGLKRKGGEGGGRGGSFHNAVVKGVIDGRPVEG